MTESLSRQIKAKIDQPMFTLLLSGSPILQAKKLAGAVIHVMVNEPGKGHGIFIENMPEQAERQTQRGSGPCRSLRPYILILLSGNSIKMETACAGACRADGAGRVCR